MSKLSHIYPGKRRKGKPAGAPEPFDRTIPKPPNYLHPNAKRQFTRMAKDLFARGVLRTVDASQLGDFCQAEHDVQFLMAEIGKKGLVYDGPNGGPVHNPLCGHLRQAQLRAQIGRDRLGLNPKSRGSIKWSIADGLPDGANDEEEREMAELLGFGRKAKAGE